MNDYLTRTDPALSEQIRIAQRNMAEAQREQVREAATEIGYQMLLMGGEPLRQAIERLADIGLPVLSHCLLKNRDYREIEYWGCLLQTRNLASIRYSDEVRTEWDDWARWLNPNAATAQ